MSPRTNQIKGPSSPAEFAREAALMARGPRHPGDDVIDILAHIREGAPIDEVEDGDFIFQEVDEPTLQIPHGEERTMSPSPVYAAPAVDVPVEILDVLKSDDRHELIEVARLLRRSHEHTKIMLFMTPVGDIKCAINWMSCRPSEISASSMFFVKTRANSLAFVPKPGAVFDIGFESLAGQVKVICLSEPQRLYPGIDLLCFMPHSSFVEKTGQLKEGAPSVVSGAPSTEIVDDEPVVAGEQPMSKAAFAIGNAATGFDNPRPL